MICCACSNGEEWYRLRSAVQRLMLDLQSVGTFLPLINPVADDFVQRIFKIRDSDTGIVQLLHNEIAKWNLECEFLYNAMNVVVVTYFNVLSCHT